MTEHKIPQPGETIKTLWGQTHEITREGRESATPDVWFVSHSSEPLRGERNAFCKWSENCWQEVPFWNEYEKNYPLEEATEKPDAPEDDVFDNFEDAEHHKDWLEIDTEHPFKVVKFEGRYFVLLNC